MFKYKTVLLTKTQPYLRQKDGSTCLFLCDLSMPFPSEGRRGNLILLFKQLDKMRGALESNAVCNLTDGHIACPKQHFCLLQPPMQDVIIGGKSCFFLERMAQRRNADVHFRCQRIHTDFLGVMCVKIIGQPLQQQFPLL